MAKEKTAKNTPLGACQRRQEQRAAAARQRRNQNMLLSGVGIAFLVIIGWVLYLNLRSQRLVAGEEFFPTLGNTHIDYGSRSPIQYNSTPPTSGPHYGNIVAWDIYDEPVRYEQLVHNMEDGGVIVYYQCEEECPDLVENLSNTVRSFIDTGRHVIMVPNDQTWSPNDGQPLLADMGARIAVTAWQRLLKLDEYDHDAIRGFIERYEGIDHHVRTP